MLRLKVAGAIIAAAMVLVVSAVGASSASAVVFTFMFTACTGGTDVALCYETAGNKNLALEGEQSATIEDGVLDCTIVTTPQQVILCEKGKKQHHHHPERTASGREAGDARHCDVHSGDLQTGYRTGAPNTS
jgi:hypothetical protein